MRHAVLAGFVVSILALSGGGAAAAAESVPGRIDAAKAAHARGDLARASAELEAVVAELHARLGKALAEFLPAAPANWMAEPPEVQGLASAGGGLAVNRAYSRDDATMNATLILDSPAVAAAAAQLAAQAPDHPNLRRLRIGAEDALMRWDSANRSGEVTMVVGGRVLLQIEGDNLGASDLLTEAAKGWNTGGLRKYLGL